MTNFHHTDRVQAVVFDWAGTIVDFGSRAPMGAFVQLFKDFGIDITIAQARGPMGAAKWDHIHALCSLPEVAGGHALLVAPNGNAIADGILAAVAGGQDISRMIDGGRARAADFSWERSAIGHARVWRSVS